MITKNKKHTFQNYAIVLSSQNTNIVLLHCHVWTKRAAL